MSDINRPASSEEIAVAIDKDKSTIARWAQKDGWEYREEAGKGRFKQRLYALTCLPQELQSAVLRKRQEKKQPSLKRMMKDLYPPRDFKKEFADYLEQNALNQQEFAALLVTAKTMVFERDKSELLGMAIHHTPIGKDDYAPRMLQRLRRHDIL